MNFPFENQIMESFSHQFGVPHDKILYIGNNTLLYGHSPDLLFQRDDWQDVKVLFSSGCEGYNFITLDLIAEISDKLVTNYNIPPQDIFYCSGCLPVSENVDVFQKNYWGINEPQLLFHNALSWGGEGAFQTDMKLDISPRKKPKKFLHYCLNARPWRTMIASKLLSLADQSSYIMSWYEDISDTAYLEQLQLLFGDAGKRSHEIIMESQDQLPIELGFHPESVYRGNPDHHLETYLSIVGEAPYISEITEQRLYKAGHTLPDYQPLYSGYILTEKTWRTIWLMHPMIMVSTCGTMNALQRMGFKTFEPYIDESYDQETRDDVRMMKIYDEIDRLNKFTTAEWIDFQHDVHDILIYNRKHLERILEEGLLWTESHVV